MKGASIGAHAPSGRRRQRAGRRYEGARRSFLARPRYHGSMSRSRPAGTSRRAMHTKREAQAPKILSATSLALARRISLISRRGRIVLCTCEPSGFRVCQPLPEAFGPIDHRAASHGIGKAPFGETHILIFVDNRRDLPVGGDEASIGMDEQVIVNSLGHHQGI